ncbi:unnamed protein product [Peronospora farinosa]|uniref:FYVE-type domain-containing protein n=1 Tax=Peronospora farinosa TaxID=134698 RepID=A0AAV0TEW4_9STRA|nr:unnamed protein product [Peronospora farinosa]CAI5720827.1 unnamed protein product [Peronospora farinosa]
MLARVLKEMKLPFPDDFFPEMTVSTQLSDDFHRTASRLLNQTLDDEMPVTRFHPSQQPDQWKLIGDRNGLQLYRERGFIKGNAVKVNVLGQMTGTLEGVLLALYASTNEALKTQRSIMHSVYLDAAVLHVIEKDPYNEDDTSFSYRFEGLKWLACAPTGKLMQKRDLCWHEQLGRTQDANGDQVGYLIMQSVRVDECPSFEKQGLTRSTAAVCYIFRPLPNNRVGVYMKGQHTVGGKSRSWSADTIMAELWLGVASALECAKAKRLSKLVSGKEMFITSTQSKTCDICDTKLKMHKSKQNCKTCGKSVCNRCRMTKMIYPSRNTDNFPCSYFFCKPCLSDVQEKLYGRSAARVSFHSEDSSGRTGSNRSGSPRYARAPLTGRPALSTISSFSDPDSVQRQRAPSQDRSRPATMPSTRRSVDRLSSRCSNISSYSSTRTTVSSSPSISFYKKPSMIPGSSSNEARNMDAYQPSTGRFLGLSGETQTAAGPPRAEHTTSDYMRCNVPSKAYGNSRSPKAPQRVVLSGDKSSNGSRYMGNQSVDSTYDVEGNGAYCGRGLISDDSEMSEESSDEEVLRAYGNTRSSGQHTVVLQRDMSSHGSRYMGNQSVDYIYNAGGNGAYRGHDLISDESDMSEESSDEEDAEVTSLSNRWKQHITVYDGDEGDEIEIHRSSEFEKEWSNEPEHVDTFEQDKLKYIKPFRSNDTAASSTVHGTTSSNGSTEQKNLMERLMQINMAAEATYLMTKYNSNIQSSSSR